MFVVSGRFPEKSTTWVKCAGTHVHARMHTDAFMLSKLQDKGHCEEVEIKNSVSLEYGEMHVGDGEMMNGICWDVYGRDE